MNDIIIILKHIDCGGIARTSAMLANALNKKGFNIKILSVCNLPMKLPFTFDKEIDIVSLTKYDSDFKYKHNILYRIKRKIIEHIKLRKIFINIYGKIIITTINDHNILLSKYGNSNCTKIAQIHHDHEYNSKLINDYKKKYHNLDYITTVAEELTEEIISITSNKTNAKIITIYNFYNNFNFDNFDFIKKNIVIAVGRFCKDKGFERLLKIWAEVVKIKKDWILYLIGDGYLRLEYEKIIEDNNIGKYVKILGFLPNDEVLKYISKSKIYAMTSKSESFSMTIIESMLLKTTVLAFDVRFGPRNIILESEKNGILVKDNDLDDYCEKLISLMENEDFRMKISNHAFERVKYFNEENIINKWLDVINRGLI